MKAISSKHSGSRSPTWLPVAHTIFSSSPAYNLDMKWNLFQGSKSLTCPWGACCAPPFLFCNKWLFSATCSPCLGVLSQQRPKSMDLSTMDRNAWHWAKTAFPLKLFMTSILSHGWRVRLLKPHTNTVRTELEQVCVVTKYSRSC